MMRRWVASQGGLDRAHWPSQESAMRSLGGNFARGDAKVRNLDTGETWRRHDGSWACVVSGKSAGTMGQADPSSQQPPAPPATDPDLGDVYTMTTATGEISVRRGGRWTCLTPSIGAGKIGEAPPSSPSAAAPATDSNSPKLWWMHED
ncbi:MAG: hypothetical protein QOJ54_1023 [Aliidongia sp.]|jgi:hypothetical protein|nr:hypothetical protein [Aliidongia sp.]